uniref:Uncharacterized protein n=1 Tax=uncultured marine microorganism HF4000_APKG2J17 TaxID=455546 RepID=B3T6J0_9ZZZZ|nr:hypothetical protein ALOHA_HF4000APKG2J17ctg1g6 [uncultured marine microorganism HF4000_APKG2J17]
MKVRFGSCVDGSLLVRVVLTLMQVVQPINIQHSRPDPFSGHSIHAQNVL